MRIYIMNIFIQGRFLLFVSVLSSHLSTHCFVNFFSQYLRTLTKVLTQSNQHTHTHTHTHSYSCGSKGGKTMRNTSQRFRMLFIKSKQWKKGKWWWGPRQHVWLSHDGLQQSGDTERWGSRPLYIKALHN